MFMSSMEFDLGDDVKAMRDAVHRWSQDTLKPLAAKIDKDNYFPDHLWRCLLYTSPSPRDMRRSRMPSSA